MVTHYTELREFLDVLKDEYKEATAALEEVDAPVPGLTHLQLMNEKSYFDDSQFKKLVDAYICASENVKSLEMTIKMVENAVFNLSRNMVKPESDTMDTGEISSAVMDKHQNLLEVVGQKDIVGDAGYVSFNPTFTDTNMDLNDFLSRPIQISTFQTAPGANAYSLIDPWTLYLGQPSVRAKLKNYAYMRATMNVKVIVSGTPFHAMQALVSYVPCPFASEVSLRYLTGIWSGAGFRSRRLTWASQSKGCKTVQVRDNQPIEISAPYVRGVPVISLWQRDQATILTAAQIYSGSDDLGYLLIESFNPLTDCASTPTNVSWYVYAYLTDVQLGCPTKTVVEITSEADERESGPVQKLATNAQSVANALMSVPWFNPYAKASSIALGALARVSSLFGWSYPVMNNEPMRMKNEPYRNAANTVGYDLAQRITLDPKQELTVDPRVSGVVEDELSISHLASIPSYFDAFTWSQTALSTSSLYSIPVYPGLVNREGLDTVVQQPTAVAFTSASFTWWRARMKYRFEVVCTQFHRGKLAFVFEPNFGQATLINSTGLTLNKQHLFVLDLQEAQTVEFCVDWASPRAFLQTLGKYLTWSKSTPLSGSGLSQEFVNGFVSVFPMTTLQSPDSGDIYINVFVSAEDVHYGFYDPLLPLTKWESDDDDQKEEYTCVTLNPTGASDSHIHELHFGESIPSFRPLLKRFCISNFLSTTTDVTAGQCYEANFPMYPTITPSATVSVPGNTEASLLNFLRPAFLGMRGGMKYRIELQNYAPGTATCVRPYLGRATTTTLAPLLGATSYAVLPQRGSLMFVPSTNGGIEFEVPFYSNLLFVSAGAPGVTYALEGPLKYNRDVVVQVSAQPNTSGPPNKLEMRVYTAVAEDFTLLRFLGATPFIPY